MQLEEGTSNPSVVKNTVLVVSGDSETHHVGPNSSETYQIRKSIDSLKNDQKQCVCSG